MPGKPRRVVLSFQRGRQRRDGARLRSLRSAYERAVAEQTRSAERLEQALRALEEASIRAEHASWALSSAEQRRVPCTRFDVLMLWLADVCKVRNSGEHFCLADLVRSHCEEDAAKDR